MTDSVQTAPTRLIHGDRLLQMSGRAWFVTAAIGQLAFVAFIAAFYGVSTFAGDFAAWNDKPLIDGHIEGDATGNMMFASHALLAIAMTLAGLMQLTPQVRAWSPTLHRYSGRAFLLTACLLALGGLWLSWVRETHLSLISGYAISINGLLILAFAALTIRHAVRREIGRHQVWAMRLFLVANGVWFLRIAMMAWIVIAQGPVGMNRTMSGPADVVMIFGCYLVPLAVYELYRRARLSSSTGAKVAAAGLVFAAAGITAIGVFGTVAFMWLPHV